MWTEDSRKKLRMTCRFLAGVTGWVAAVTKTGTQEEEQMAWGGGTETRGLGFGACRILRF